MLQRLSPPVASEQDRVGPGGARECQLVEGHALAVGAFDSSASGLRETEGADGESFRDGEEPLIVEHLADGDGDLAFVLFVSQVFCNVGDRDRVPRYSRMF